MNVTVVKSKLDNLANAIGIKAKKRVPQTIDELIETVESIKTTPTLQDKSIDPKVQEQIITPDNGYDGLSSVTINKAKLQSKDIQPSNQTQYISSDDGYLGLKDVFVQAMNLTSAIVTPQPNENILTASDDGYDGFSSVTVQPIPDSYVQPTGCMAINQQGYYDVSKYQSANVISNLVNKRITPTDSPQLVSAFPTSNCGLYDKYYEGGIIYYTFPLDINKVYMSTMHITLTITNNRVVEINTIQPVVYPSTSTSAKLYMDTKPSILISQSGTTITCYNDDNSRNVKNITVDYLNVIECADKEKIYNLYLVGRDNDTESKLYDVDFSSLNDNDTIYIFGSFDNLLFQYYIKWDSNKDLSFQPPSDSSSNSFKILPSQGKINISRSYNTYVHFSIAKCNQQYDGLSSVFVDAIPADYIGSGITIDPTPTITGATVNIPTGYYSTDTVKTIESVNHANPSMSIDSSTGIITASHTQGSGYVTGGTTQATLELSTQNATTITPSATSQTAVAAGKYTLGNVVVNAVPTESKTVTENGDVVPSTGKFLSKVTVNVQPVNQNKTVTPSEEEQSITFDSGYTGLGTVTVGAISSTYIGSDIAQDPSPTVSGAVVNIPSGYYSESVSKSVATATQATPSVSINTANGLITATATQTAGYVASGSKSGTLQLTTKAATTITPTESAQTAVNKNVYTLGAITVAAIPSNYIGSDIDVDPNPTVSGSTVTIPSGYYSEATSKSVNSGSATTPATTITANPSISINTETGLITASTSATKSVTPTVSAGYISTGTAGTITASGSNTSQLTTVNAKTVTPTEEEQTVVNKNVYTLGAIKVGAISSTYVGSDITTDPTPTASGATVTIPAGYYSTSTSKSVATTTHPKPSASIDATTGIVTASHSQTVGYVTAGTTTGTLQLTTKAGTSIDPTEEAQTAINAGTYALGNIIINAIPSTYVGSDITQDPTPTVSGATVNIPAGYYSTATSKSVSSTTQATPSISIDSTTGVVTATATQSAGYISAGSKSNTLSLDTIEAATISPTEEEQTAAAKGVYTLGTIKVGAISSTYVGSGITRRSSTNLSVDGAKVFVPAGYYSTSASASVKSMTLPSSESGNPSGTTKATVKRYSDDVYINIPSGYNSEAACYVISGVPNGSATAPASISGTAATVSTGTNTLTLTKTVSVTPTVTAGYISSGTAGDSSISLTANVTVDPTPTASGATVTIPSGYYTTQTTKSVSTGTASAPTSISGTTATVSTGTNTLTLTKTVSVTPVVSAGYVSSGTATNSSVSLTASVTTKAAATITPGTTNQTIASGTYLTGTQTIAGDADLVATNIASGVQIFGVNGTFTADATAETTDILDGKSAYVNGRKVQGTLVVNRYYTGATDPSSSLGNDGDIYLKE